jgi:transketolase
MIIMLTDMRDAFFEELLKAARVRPELMFLTADHGAHALEQFQVELPDRFINVGISEQNMIGVAAGLASRGKVVFAYGIAPFVSLRVLEHLSIDVAAMGLAVNVVSVGAGFTYSTDGPTHHGLQDLPAILTVPNITILNSSDPTNTRSFVQQCIESKSPHYIRIEKEKLDDFDRLLPFEALSKDGYSLICRGTTRKLLVISTGSISHQVIRILKLVKDQVGFEPAMIDLHQIKPISKKLLDYVVSFENVITLEEGYSTGLGSAILNATQSYSLSSRKPSIHCVGAEEKFFFEAGSRGYMLNVARVFDRFKDLVKASM